MKIRSKNVYIEEEFQEAIIEFVGGKISNITKNQNEEVDVDYGSMKILPGFIDIHCHGYQLMSANYANYEGMKRWIKQLPYEGVTSFLPSTSTAPEKNLLASFELLSKLKQDNIQGTHILGINVEGPQISFTHNGAQNPYDIQKPDIDQFKRYQAAANGNIKLITIASEMDDNHELIKYCSSQGVRVSLGHSGADFDETVSAVNDGARSFTHTFNGMTQMDHRKPGVAGAAMILDEAYAELIADGIHVHSCAAQILARCKGKDKLIIVTDSVQIKGLNEGVHESFGRTYYVSAEGSVRLGNGRLAGSTNCIHSLVRNAIEVMKIDEVTVFNSVTINPARFLGCQEKGLIAIGKDADIVILDENYEVHDVYLLGEKYTEPRKNK